MLCPHCLVAFNDPPPERTTLPRDCDGEWQIRAWNCPTCHRSILHLCRGQSDTRHVFRALSTEVIRPRGASRAPAPPDVPEPIAEDHREACLVLPSSAKAAAALARRCLQHVLRDAAGVKPGNLANEIQHVIDSDGVPSYVKDSLDAGRNFGNFAAHPTPNAHTGEIIDVEPGEVDWTLDTIETLFDFYYVAPARIREKRAALNAKLAEAGKPPMKGATESEPAN